MEKPSFGKSLEEHLNISGREIAFPIEACVTMLLECGMQEEARRSFIFRFVGQIFYWKMSIVSKSVAQFYVSITLSDIRDSWFGAGGTIILTQGPH